MVNTSCHDNRDQDVYKGSQMKRLLQFFVGVNHGFSQNSTELSENSSQHFKIFCTKIKQQADS